MAIRDPRPLDEQKGDPAKTEHAALAGGASGMAASPNQIQAALRIRAALRAALQDSAAEDRLPDGQWHEWTWTVKALPRPPLAVTGAEELDGEELLANDSLGG